MTDRVGNRPSGDVPPSAAATVLNASLNDLVQESRALRADVHDAEAARRRATKLAGALLGLVAVFIALVAVISWQNNRLVGQVKETNSRMADCTTPGGHCYDESIKRTGDAIGDIVRASIFMSQCARLYPGEFGPEYDKKLEKCVYERLEEAAKGRQAPSSTSTPSPLPTGGG
jgi:hypothetical protein